jgi:multidrug resistance efflux pump
MKKYLLTGTVVLVLILVALLKYWEYVSNPWTRDGQVQATVIQVAPRISGPLVKLPIKNNQFVNKGDLLFEIDPRTFQAALDQSKADLESARADAAEAKDLADRARNIRAKNKGAMSKEELNSRESNLLSAQAQISKAEAAVENDRLNLEFTRVLAPADGYATNLSVLRLGSQMVANQPALALLDISSYWVDAYFREDTIGDIQIGDQAVVTLMTYPDIPLKGRVESIGWGIYQQDGSSGSNLLPSIEASFEWIRLAQRVPVLIHLEQVPDEVKLRVGTTASVLVRIGTSDQPDDSTPTSAPAVLR